MEWVMYGSRWDQIMMDEPGDVRIKAGYPYRTYDEAYAARLAKLEAFRAGIAARDREKRRRRRWHRRALRAVKRWCLALACVQQPKETDDAPPSPGYYFGPPVDPDGMEF
ncbi:hypothetical protein ACP70R_029067 [Stipagrostis hirtigluma subsp. patula]